MKNQYVNFSGAVIRVLELTIFVACILTVALLFTNKSLGQESPEAVESRENTPQPVYLITAIKINDEKPGKYISFELMGTQEAEYSHNMLPPVEPDGPYYFYINIKNSHTMLNRGKQFSKKFVSPLVTRIRVSQYTLEPTPITRVVFDVPEPIEPDIKAIKGSLLISFASNKVSYDSGATIPETQKRDKTEPAIEIVKDEERLKEIISQITADHGDEDVKIVIFPLKYHKAEVLKNVVERFLTPIGVAAADSWTNSLVVKDIAEGIRDAQYIIEKLDIDTAAERELNKPIGRLVGKVLASGPNVIKLSYPNRLMDHVSLYVPRKKQPDQTEVLDKKISQIAEKLEPGKEVWVKWKRLDDKMWIISIKELE